MLTAVVAMLPSSAAASQLVDRRTRYEVLKVNRKGVAMVYYKARGRRHHVAYWGARNADRDRPSTLEFRGDRSGGLVSGVADYRRFRNVCGRYKGPPLRHVVRACTHPDGSHWVLQKWARMTANYGGNPGTTYRELRLSHFTGNPARLTITPNWTGNGSHMHVVAELSYRGSPWYAINFTTSGNPTDKIGRNVHFDSYNSDLGSGWRRVNAVLTHRPKGQLCYGFSPKTLPDGSKSGTGYSNDNLYRAGLAGPGVSPDVFVNFRGVRLEDHTPEIDDPIDQYIRDLIGTYTGKHNCRIIN